MGKQKPPNSRRELVLNGIPPYHNDMSFSEFSGKLINTYFRKLSRKSSTADVWP